jgi:hypothetical protein
MNIKETLMTAFGSDFGGMCLGDDKTGQNETNGMFGIDPTDIPNILKDQMVTYGNVVVDHRPPKEDPNGIRITAGNNLINYLWELTTRTADIITSKLNWNRMMSTQKAKYMCIGMKNFYLLASLDRYKSMHILIGLFPSCIVNQYDLIRKVYNAYIHLEMCRAVWGLPQASILANKLLQKRLAPHEYYKCKQTLGKPWTLEAYLPSNVVYTGGRQLWGKI